MGELGEYFYVIAALLSGSAYILRNMLWLRIMLVLAALFYIFAGIYLSITAIIGWNFVFLLINSAHIGWILLNRLTISLPPETRLLYHQHFNTLTTREFKKLITTNSFHSVNGAIIVEEDAVPDKLFVILSGQVNILRSGKVIASLNTGNMIGEMSFLSKEPASANAVAVDEVQCAYWTHDDLEKLKIKNLDLYDRFIAIVGCDLVRKLKKENQIIMSNNTHLDFVL